MSSVIRFGGGQLMNAHFITIQRQSQRQFNKYSRTIYAVPAIYHHRAYDARRNYYNFQWDRQKGQQQSKPFGVFELISIGCVSVAIYNWKRYMRIFVLMSDSEN